MSRVDIVRKYVKARQEEDIETILSLVDDNVHFSSAKDGIFDGKPAFAKYLEDSKTPPKSEWEDPVEEDGKIVLRGKVRVLLIWWTIITVFTFNDADKLIDIEVKRKE